jgi:transcriptional regulator with XRE-family HTH domain
MAVTNLELLKLGLRIRAFRKGLGRNQKDFSKLCGLDRSYFGGVERGERNLSFFILCQICAGLKCDIAAVTKGIPHRQPLRSSRNARNTLPHKPGASV